MITTTNEYILVEPIIVKKNNSGGLSDIENGKSVKTGIIVATYNNGTPQGMMVHYRPSTAYFETEYEGKKCIYIKESDIFSYLT